MRHADDCAKYGTEQDWKRAEALSEWGYEPPFRPCDCNGHELACLRANPNRIDCSCSPEWRAQPRRLAGGAAAHGEPGNPQPTEETT